MFVRIPQETGMWGLGCLWATCDDPRPLYIDEQDLNEDLKLILDTDLESGRVFEVDENDKRIHKKVREPIKKQHGLFQEQDKDIEALPPVLLHLVKEFLKQGVVSIRKNIDQLDTAIALAGAIALEKKGKDRKTVIAMLEKKLSESKDLSKGSLFRTANMYDMLIDEEQGETITFDTSDLEMSETIEEILESPQENTAIEVKDV